MSVGQRVQFTKTADVATTLVAHPSGILEITRHTDHHQLQKLFGQAKGINGHSDAEVMLYLLAVQTGWFDKFTGQCPPSAHATGETKCQEYLLTIEAEFVRGDRLVLHTRRGDGPRRLVCDVPFLTAVEARNRIREVIDARQPDERAVKVELVAVGLGAALFDLLKQEQQHIDFVLTRRNMPFPTTETAPTSSLMDDSRPDASRFKSETVQQSRGSWQCVAIAGSEAPPLDRMTMVPIVVDNGYARAPREGEKPTGNAVVLGKPMSRVTDAAPNDGAVKKQPDDSGGSPRKLIVLYADAIGVPTTKDGATEDIVAEIFARVSAGGEAAAFDILPGRQSLLAKLRETARTPADVVDVVLGACQRALALWMSRENFLRHKFRRMMHHASKLILQASPPDGEDRAQWVAQRDDLVEAIQWIDPEMGSKNYHPSHDAETAFDTLHNGLGYKPGTAVLTLAELAKVAIGRVREAAQPTPPEPAAQEPSTNTREPEGAWTFERFKQNAAAEAAQHGYMPSHTKDSLVVGGPQRLPWHSGTGQGTGVF